MNNSQQTMNSATTSARGWYLLALICIVMAAVLRQPILVVFGVFAGIIGIIPVIWSVFAFKRLDIRQSIDKKVIPFGETLTYDLIVENRKLLPLPWLNVTVEIPLDISLNGGHIAASYKVNRKDLPNTYSLWALQRVTHRYTIRCVTRGVKTFGPIQIESGDPLGWQTQEMELLQSNTAIVLPLIFSMDVLWLPSKHPQGDFSNTWRLMEDPSRMIGVRDYIPGDDPRAIHWKATARTGMLMTRIFDPSSQQKLLVALDITTFPEVRTGIDPDIMELLIATAASLISWAVEQTYAVGLVSNGRAWYDGTGTGDAEEKDASFLQSINIPIQVGVDHQDMLLEALARIITFFGYPIGPILTDAMRSQPVGTTIALIIARNIINDELLDLLDQLRRHGYVVALLLVGEASQDVPEMLEGILTFDVGGREKWHELLATRIEDSSNA